MRRQWPQAIEIAGIHFWRFERNQGAPGELARWGGAGGFINLWGLPDTVQALREQGKLK